MMINPYINFNGNTEEAFNFYKSVFGGEFSNFQRFKDTPQGSEMSAEDGKKVMHVALMIGKNALMGSDFTESMGGKFVAGTNFSISLMAESKEEADRLFNALSAGGIVEMPLADTFWGAYFGMWKDKFGVAWMINYDYPKN